MIEPSVGMRLQLLGISKAGKQRLQEFASVWRVVIIEDSVLFSHRGGPWLFIEALVERNAERLRSGRWIHGRLDKDFMVLKEV